MFEELRLVGMSGCMCLPKSHPLGTQKGFEDISSNTPLSPCPHDWESKACLHFSSDGVLTTSLGISSHGRAP